MSFEDQALQAVTARTVVGHDLTRWSPRARTAATRPGCPWRRRCSRRGAVRRTRTGFAAAARGTRAVDGGARGTVDGGPALHVARGADEHLEADLGRGRVARRERTCRAGRPRPGDLMMCPGGDVVRKDDFRSARGPRARCRRCRGDRRSSGSGPRAPAGPRWSRRRARAHRPAATRKVCAPASAGRDRSRRRRCQGRPRHRARRSRRRSR